MHNYDNETANKNRTEIKLRILTQNKNIPVYGFSIPHQIAVQFIYFEKFTATISGNAIIFQPVQ